MILDDIAAATSKRVSKAKESIPLKVMQRRAYEITRGDFRFEKALKEEGISFICEVKKASPSKGMISENFPYIEIARDYEEVGADAISVLTEPDYFLGNDRYLSEIKQNVNIPLLRKDFIIDNYQLYEAKVLGADAVLLICALIDIETIKKYLEICESLGLCALVEVHTAKELESAVTAGAKIIGINNRNLKTFEVNLKTFTSLRPLVPKGVLVVAESGIKTTEDIAVIRDAGVDAVLIGETLMRSEDKKMTLKNLREEGEV